MSSENIITVQDLIDFCMKIEDKSLPVCVEAYPQSDNCTMVHEINRVSLHYFFPDTVGYEKYGHDGVYLRIDAEFDEDYDKDLKMDLDFYNNEDDIED